jgi:NhaC family Na+:H+ antiporter
MMDGIKNGLGACIILIVIGMVVGTWILSGTIQTMIYYGLKLLTPQIFVPVAFLLCSLTSVLIGSSFGTIATMGIVLMGVAEGLGVPSAITAGAIVAGAMFGDKVSPLSDSTNLTAAMTGTKLFDHVRSMLYVSGPGMIISLIIYGFVGRNYAAVGNVNLETVDSILSTLSSNFNISLVTLVPAAIVIILSVLKVPAIAALMISFISAGISSIFTQGASLAGIIEVGANGFVSNTGHELIDKLLTQGGINSMMSTVAIIMAGTAMGGILEKCGILQVLLETLMKYIEKPRDLILASLASAYVMLLATGEMMVSIIVPGRTLEPAFREMKIHTSVLSRTLETGATLMCGALPWGVASVYAQNVLGVGLEYIPYCYLPFIAPIIAIIYAFMGFATFPAESEES